MGPPLPSAKRASTPYPLTLASPWVWCNPGLIIRELLVLRCFPVVIIVRPTLGAFSMNSTTRAAAARAATGRCGGCRYYLWFASVMTLIAGASSLTWPSFGYLCLVVVVSVVVSVIVIFREEFFRGLGSLGGTAFGRMVIASTSVGWLSMSHSRLLDRFSDNCLRWRSE